MALEGGLSPISGAPEPARLLGVRASDGSGAWNVELPGVDVIDYLVGCRGAVWVSARGAAGVRLSAYSAESGRLLSATPGGGGRVLCGRGSSAVARLPSSGPRTVIGSLAADGSREWIRRTRGPAAPQLIRRSTLYAFEGGRRLVTRDLRTGRPLRSYDARGPLVDVAVVPPAVVVATPRRVIALRPA